jgi:hypothetical protein
MRRRRFAVALRGVQGESPVVVELRLARIQGDGPVEKHQRLVRASALLQRDAQVVDGDGVPGIEGERLAVAALGFVQPPVAVRLDARPDPVGLGSRG